MYKRRIRLKKWYVRFAEEGGRSFFEKLLYIPLYPLSLLYGLVVSARNFFYSKNIINTYNPAFSFLVGVGNISWSGTGKTSFTLWLFRRFSFQFKTAVLRRGYGDDEEKLIKQECESVFSSPGRRRLVKELEKDYDLFILDDAFQYRKLQKDIEVVIMGAREFIRKPRLIPLSFFREPLGSIGRADILIINYKEEADRKKIKKIVSRFPFEPEIYFAGYKAQSLQALGGQKYDLNFLRGKKTAAFAAVGHPQGFFQLLEKTGIPLRKKVTYPDHYILSAREYLLMEQSLISLGVKALVITEKDKYHLPEIKKRVDVFVLNVRLEVEQEDRLVAKIREKISAKLNR